MPIALRYVDWSRPALPAAVGYLFERFAEGRTADLGNVIVVVPGAHAARRLLELLVERAEVDGRVSLPPRIITIGDLPELLYETKLPFANPLTQELAWVQALKETPPHELERIARRPPAPDDRAGWLALGEILVELHRELAAEALNFGHVTVRLEEAGAAFEAERWRILEGVQDRYYRTLDSLELWDLQAARLFAIEHREFATDCEIVLVGLIDLNQAQRAVLEQVGEHVTALVFAPEDRRDWFDAHGCVKPECWQDHRLDGLAERTEVVSGPGEQALAVVRALERLGDHFTAAEVVIGVPDERILPLLRQRMEEAGAAVRPVHGESVRRSSPGRLLRALAGFVDRRSFRAFANLVRHPDVDRWLRTRIGTRTGTRAQEAAGGWLNELDDYYNTRLPLGLGKELLTTTGRPRREHEAKKDGLAAAFRAVNQWVAPLHGPERGLHEWAEVIRTALAEVYGGRLFDRNDADEARTVAAFHRLDEALERIGELPPLLAPLIGGAEALRLAWRQFERDRVPELPTPGAIELVGWLDLRTDDAPVAIVTGMNEGVVPNSKSGDAFLPNELRRRMSLDDNDRRYARDLYAMAAMMASKAEVRFIAGRRTAENDPLVPSRLLMACADGELPRRVRVLFRPPRESADRVPLSGSPRPGRERSAFEVPLPVRLPEPVVSMRVTEFADYLNCPYRYYLKQRLRLETRATTALEMPASAFGDLIHDALEMFGLSKDVRDSDSADEIFEFLSAKLDAMAAGTFGDDPLPAVRVQVEQARERLKAFAGWQARWRRDGWRVFTAEQKIDSEKSFLLVDGVPMLLRGRLDRIDVRESHGRIEVAILDYKTGDAGASPEDKHVCKKTGRWLDLQLPLYRHLVRAVDGVRRDVTPRTGYILLPKDLSQVGDKLASWTGEHLETADREAERVVRGVRQESFWPPAPDVEYYAEFAAICHAELFAASGDGEI